MGSFFFGRSRKNRGPVSELKVTGKGIQRTALQRRHLQMPEIFLNMTLTNNSQSINHLVNQSM